MVVILYALIALEESNKNCKLFLLTMQIYIWLQIVTCICNYNNDQVCFHTLHIINGWLAPQLYSFQKLLNMINTSELVRVMQAILPVQLNQPGGHPLSLIYHLHHHCSFYCQTNMEGFCSPLQAIIVIVSHFITLCNCKIISGCFV